MFDNAITMNIDGSDRVLTRVNQDKFASTYRYRSASLLADLNVRHTSRASAGSQVVTDRHNVELSLTTYAPVTGAKQSRKAYFVLENPANIDTAEAEDPLLALNAFFGTSGQIARLVNWES